MNPILRASAAGLALAALVGSAHAAETTPGPARAGAPGPARPAVPPLFSKLLPDAAGKELVVVNLTLLPATAEKRPPHRHPGSVLVYVTKGTARLGVEGQPVQVVRTGETFFEAPGALHTVAESASATEPATAIAVMIVPEGAPLTTVEPAHAAH